jgi:competence protein ComEC
MLSSVFSDADIVRTANEKAVRVNACISGQSWTWDGVRFDVLHPDPVSYTNAALKTNDRSCVIKVTASTMSVLLTGDIEARSEAELVAANPHALRADALLVPHHGSTTSSTEAFLDAVQPKIALVNSGYRNRFGHPRDTVLARYAERNIELVRTDHHGAIRFDSDQSLTQLHRERDRRQRYWTDRVDGADRRPIE